MRILKPYLFPALLILALPSLSACDSQAPVAPDQSGEVDTALKQEPMLPGKLGLMSSPDDPCPNGANTCVPITPGQWQDMRDDILMVLNQDDPWCAAALGELDLLYSRGKLYVYDDAYDNFNRKILGWWEMTVGSNPDETVSFNSGLWQGWASHRPRVGIHESYHAFYNSNNESSAESFESNCMEW